MTTLTTLFSDGGPWCIAILVIGLLLYAGIGYQYRQAGRRDITALLWAGVAALVLFGLLASALGQRHAFGSPEVIDRLDVALFARIVGVSLSTTVLATAMAAGAALATGAVAHRVRARGASPR
jgi:ABC-type nitrate/sulfonate/bicarbonate transport system permease component